MIASDNVKKRLLFFLESLSGGGAEKVLADIVYNLDSSKYDITVCNVTDNGIYQNRVEQCGHYRSFVKQTDCSAGGIRKLFYRIKIKMTYNLPPQLVYLFFFRNSHFDVEIAFIEGFATKLISASYNKKSRKIAWVHIDMEKNQYAQNSFASKEKQIKTYKKFDQICCVSESVKKSFQRNYVDDRRVVIQYNPVDTEHIRNMANEEAAVSRGKGILLGTVGRLEHQKGYLRLLDAVSKCIQCGHPIHLVILGVGSQRAELEDKIKTQGLKGHVELMGFMSNPYKILKLFDAFICSSYAEGFSTAATEALILGVPVFTTDCAGMRELFGTFRCGEIVPNTDDELNNMILNLASGKWKPHDYREEALKRGETFDLKSRIKEIEQIIDG